MRWSSRRTSTLIADDSANHPVNYVEVLASIGRWNNLYRVANLAVRCLKKANSKLTFSSRLQRLVNSPLDFRQILRSL